ITMQTSTTRRPIRIEVTGKGTSEGELYRHKAPLTVGVLLRSLPISGRAVRYRDEFVYFTTNIVVGLEKPTQTFKKGDIAFFPMNGSICFFLKDCQVSQHMSRLGQVTKALDILNSLTAGDVITISAAL
ncbi:MAG: cyclophilin-like fold protein, partial [Nitrososphaerales archaeon]